MQPYSVLLLLCTSVVAYGFRFGTFFAPAALTPSRSGDQIMATEDDFDLFNAFQPLGTPTATVRPSPDGKGTVHIRWGDDAPVANIGLDEEEEEQPPKKPRGTYSWDEKSSDSVVRNAVINGSCSCPHQCFRNGVVTINSTKTGRTMNAAQDGKDGRDDRIITQLESFRNEL